MKKTTTSTRRAPRLPTRLEGVLSGRSERAVTVMDLSLTGCLIRCAAPLDSGAIMDLRMALDTGTLLTAKVRVTESYLDGSSVPEENPSYLAGLSFLSLSAQEEAHLRRFLEAERRRRSGADAPTR